jgi:hypothetical protein
MAGRGALKSFPCNKMQREPKICGEDTTVSLVVEGGQITRILAINNPHKLHSLQKVVELRL